MFCLGHKSIKTTETYSYLTDKHLQAVVSRFPRPNLGTNTVTPDVLFQPGILHGRNASQEFVWIY